MFENTYDYVVRLNKLIAPDTRRYIIEVGSLSLNTPRRVGVEAALRKLVLVAANLLGVGYIVVNIPIVVFLGYQFLEIPIESTQNIGKLAGLTLFLIASILLMILGCFFIIGGLQFYRGSAHEGVVFLGSLLASFYLLCLGMGSLFVVSQLNLSVMLLIISPVVVMGAVATYMGRSIPFKLIGSALGIVGGMLLAVAIFNHQILEPLFGWNVPFPGPFMSVATLEAIVAILGPVTAFVYSILAERREEPVAHAFLSIVALLYGIGMFISSQVLAFSFLDLLWKAPWVGPFHGVPPWMFAGVAFWSAGLFLLMIGGIIMIVSSCVGFIFTAQEFAQL